MVNTFLPYKSFEKSAKVLDNKRLYKQIVECKQILNILKNKTEKKGYRNHPIVHMWRGYEKALKYYQWCMFKEWAKRRWKFKLKDIIKKPNIFPPWLGEKKFHVSHRSNLLRKNKEHYGSFNWKESDDLDYIWIKS